MQAVPATLAPFLKGLLFGITIAAPVGPIALLCTSRTLARGWLTGLVSGLGAATADAIYGIIAAGGYTVIGHLLSSHAYWLRLAGSLFLAYLGIRIVCEKPALREEATISRKGLAGAYGSTALLTLANPMTLLLFAAIIAGSSIGHTMSMLSTLLLVLGVFCGSTLWWLCLCGGIGLLRRRISLHTMQWLNRASGSIILLYAVAMLVQMFFA